MADLQESAKMDHLNELNQPNLDKVNGKGLIVKPLVIKQLEMEYWEEIAFIQNNQNIKTIADSIRWALKRANGKL